MKDTYNLLRKLGASHQAAKELTRLMPSLFIFYNEAEIKDLIKRYTKNLELGNYLINRIEPSKQRSGGNVKSFDRYDLVSQSFLNSQKKLDKLEVAYSWFSEPVGLLPILLLSTGSAIAAIALVLDTSVQTKQIANGTLAKVVKDTAIQADRPHAPMYRSNYDLETLDSHLNKTVGLGTSTDPEFTVTDLEYILLSAFDNLGVNELIKEYIPSLPDL